MFAEESWFRRELGLRSSPMDALVGMVDVGSHSRPVWRMEGDLVEQSR